MYKGLRLERLRCFPERETKQCSWGTVSRVIPGLSLLGGHSSLPPLQPRARTWPLLALTSSPAWPIILPPLIFTRSEAPCKQLTSSKAFSCFPFLDIDDRQNPSRPHQPSPTASHSICTALGSPPQHFTCSSVPSAISRHPLPRHNCSVLYCCKSLP